MGRIGTILEVVIDTLSKLKVALGGGDNRTVSVMQPAGSDSFPLPTDKAILISSGRTGAQAAVGFFDTKNAPVAAAGEHRIYARDADGNVVVEVHLFLDGSAVMKNTNGEIELDADGSSRMINDGGVIELPASGTVNINGITIDPGGNIEGASLKTTGTVEGFGLKDNLFVPPAVGPVTLGTHIHTVVTPPAGPTGPPT